MSFLSNCSTLIKIFSSFAWFVCPSVILESSCLFKSRLLVVCWAPAGYWRPGARISRILAVFGFSSLSSFGNSSISLFGFVKSPLHWILTNVFNQTWRLAFRTEAEIQDDDDCFTLKVGEPWQTSVSDLLRPIKPELGVVSTVTTCYKDLVQGLDHQRTKKATQIFISWHEKHRTDKEEKSFGQSGTGHTHIVITWAPDRAKNNYNYEIFVQTFASLKKIKECSSHNWPRSAYHNDCCSLIGRNRESFLLIGRGWAHNSVMMACDDNVWVILCKYILAPSQSLG